MPKIFRITIPMIFVPLLFSISACGGDAADAVRPPVLAGEWYPAAAAELRKSIERYLLKAEPVAFEDELTALIVPHAGHEYSGPTAAYAYNLLKNKKFDRVVILGPSHRFSFNGVSVGMQKGFRTPLGIVPVDQEFGRRLLTPDSLIRRLPEAHAYEHSLEIQLPFLQTVLKQARIVPIVMGDDNWATCARLAQKLVEQIKSSGKTLLIASSDLSHFYDAGRARNLDREFIRHVQALDPESLLKALRAGKTEACGRAPVLTVLLAAKALGADRALILHYAHSGEISGDNGRVVGYVSAALIKKK